MMLRCSREDKAEVMQRSVDEDKVEERPGNNAEDKAVVMQ